MRKRLTAANISLALLVIWTPIVLVLYACAAYHLL